ncbi:MAG: sensor histidine kinase [Actinomycetota bacterium]
MKTETDAPPSTEPPRQVPEERAETAPSRRRLFRGVRARILFWSTVSLVAGIVVAVIVVRQATLVQLDRWIDGSLEQKADELEALSGGRDPLTGERFGTDVRRIFEVFLERNVPTSNEAYLAFVGGRLIDQRKAGGPAFELEDDVQLMQRWGDLEGSERDSVDTPTGTVEYLAVPLRDGGDVQGVFVTAFFRDLEADKLSSAVTGGLGVGLIVLLLGSWIAWRIAESVLRPVRAVTATARRIGGTGLTERLPVTGHDELSELSATFNDMLDQLEDAFDTQQRFLDDAGHELRTPITVIRGHLDLMGEDPQDRRATLALVDDELEGMHRIVNDLLTLAKAERTDFLRFEPVDLAAVTNDIHAKAAVLGPRDWGLGEVCHGIVIADRQRLTQAMMQLAQNAVQHTSADARIEIGSRLRGTEAELSVSDRGDGIAADEVEHIFDRFARGRRRRPSEGAGLGLSIVRAIAEAHHGRATVESVLGKGSRFAIAFPADQPVDEDGLRA